MEMGKMPDIARHVKIFDKNPSDELVTKRSSAIVLLTEQYKKLKTISDLLQLVEDILAGLESPRFELPPIRVDEIEAAIKVDSPAFDREDEELQMLVCMVLATLELIKTSTPGTVLWTTHEAIAVGLWLGLSFQAPLTETRFESLRVELVQASQELISKSAETSRARTIVPDVAIKMTDVADAAKVGAAINTGANKAVSVLRANASLDREELDLLWWALGDWSELQNQHYAQLSIAGTALTAGVEAARILRRLPAESHRQLALRRVYGRECFTFAQLAVAMAESLDPIRMLYAGNAYVSSYPRTFKLFSSIVSGKSLGGERSLRDWGSRALLEAAVIRIAETTTVN
jgi:hypothetical protein